jgi:hypothetical protein
MTTEKTLHGKLHVRFIPAMLSAAMLLAAASACAEGTNFTHGLSGQKPWTDKPFLDDPEEFHFAVIGDRTGGERPGFFGPAMDMLNLLRPEFVMSVGDLIEWGGNERAREMWAEEAKAPADGAGSTSCAWRSSRGPARRRGGLGDSSGTGRGEPGIAVAQAASSSPHFSHATTRNL